LGKEDCWAWKDDATTAFSVNSGYNILRGYVKGKVRLCSILFGRSRLCLQLILHLGGCWEIRLLLRLTLLEEGLQLIVFPVVCVGRKMRQQSICSLIVELFG